MVAFISVVTLALAATASAAYTPNRSTVKDVVSRRDSKKPWHYGGLMDDSSRQCYDLLNSATQYPDWCESYVGTENFCFRAGGEDCFRARESPVFIHRPKDCDFAQESFQTENCVGTEAWCQEEGSLKDKAITRNQCTERRQAWDLCPSHKK